MARHPRIEFPNAVYYLVNRGNAGHPIFKGDEDRALLLKTLEETCRKTGWEVLAWCLVPGHFQLLVRTPQANLAAGMKWLLGAYTIRFNRRHKLIGHLFAGRYRSVFVEPTAPFLSAVADFIHLSPAREGFAKPQPLREYAWSSLGEYLRPAAERPAWFNPALLLGALALNDDTEGRRQFEQSVEQARHLPANTLWPQVRRGWCVGSGDFRRTLLGRLAAPGTNSTAPNRELARERAELIVREEFQALGWTEATLAERSKGDAEKVRIGRRLRAETTVSLRWVAQRLRMGAWGYAAACLAGDQPVAAPRNKPRRPTGRPSKPRKPMPAPAEPSAAGMEELPVHCL